MKVSKAFKWYAEHPKELQSYAGRHIAIVNDGVAAVADTAAQKRHTNWQSVNTQLKYPP